MPETIAKIQQCTARIQQCTAKIQQCISEDCHQTIRDTAAKFGIGHGTGHRNLSEELGTHRVAAKLFHTADH